MFKVEVDKTRYFSSWGRMQAFIDEDFLGPGKLETGKLEM